MKPIVEVRMDDELIFAEEDEEIEVSTQGYWNILIVDDEVEIHRMTQGVLEDFSFDQKTIRFLNAYNGEEAKQILRENDDIALILLDVVMETDDAGLEVARFIRDELNNRFVRIVLRTGQPGLCPEKEVIIKFDINDYKSKTELTVQKLYTAIVSSLRSYRDLRLIENQLQVIEKNRRGLEKIIEASTRIFEIQSFKKFTNGILMQLLSLLQTDDQRFYDKTTGFIASEIKGQLLVQSATGKFEPWIESPLKNVDLIGVQEHLKAANLTQGCYFATDTYVDYFILKSGTRHVLYVDGCGELGDLDKDLIRIFSRNVAIAFENINLNQEIEETQKEVITTLGEVVESRSKETASHVHRMAEFCYKLAIFAGIDEEEAELLRLAAPMHDVGKIGIPDSILLKPGRLTADEFEEVKKHTILGYEILKGSNRKILKTAAIIAYQHQEKWDGSGYPQGLRGEQIHIFGRISCLVDVFDALIHDRCYKEAWSVDQAIEYIRSQKGKHFDPKLVDVFFQHLPEFLSTNLEFPDGRRSKNNPLQE